MLMVLVLGSVVSIPISSFFFFTSTIFVPKYLQIIAKRKSHSNTNFPQNISVTVSGAADES
jgi:hypothetical protein